MNDVKFVLQKLRRLMDMARDADDDFERAAAYAASMRVLDDLRAESQGRESESFERLRWSLAAILGYDVTNDYDNSQHFVWALGAFDVIERLFCRS
ncbi:hypothetical protein [Chitinolyticbacter meiyuanensis]|uniref:hypothetical protein n=1 Tax=Chitinolyticbacter meiyuanensis TaxID=682798 RepID=UPI0011E5E8B2|nr:hypothetical protein [Chitinolyticbacter meiyuanensis]